MQRPIADGETQFSAPITARVIFSKSLMIDADLRVWWKWREMGKLGDAEMKDLFESFNQIKKHTVQ